MARWRREMQDGTRTITTIDAVWRAACREAADEEWQREFGTAPMAAHRTRERAREQRRPSDTDW